MANVDQSSGKPAIVDNSIFKLVMQAAVPALLGVLITLAASINTAQREQGEKLSELNGKIGVMSQQYTDIGGRLSKVETGVDDNRRSIGVLTGRVLVLESIRRK